MFMAGLPLPAPKFGLVLGYLAYGCLWLVSWVESNACTCDGTIFISFTGILSEVQCPLDKEYLSRDWDSISPNTLEMGLRRKSISNTSLEHSSPSLE